MGQIYVSRLRCESVSGNVKSHYGMIEVDPEGGVSVPWLCCLYYYESERSAKFPAYPTPFADWVLRSCLCLVPRWRVRPTLTYNALFSEKIKHYATGNKTFSLNTCRYWWVFREQPMRSSVPQFTRKLHLFLSQRIQTGCGRLELWR